MVKVVYLLKDMTFFVRNEPMHPAWLPPTMDLVKPEPMPDLSKLDEGPLWMTKARFRKAAVDHNEGIAVYEEIEW